MTGSPTLLDRLERLFGKGGERIFDRNETIALSVGSEEVRKHCCAPPATLDTPSILLFLAPPAGPAKVGALVSRLEGGAWLVVAEDHGLEGLDESAAQRLTIDVDGEELAFFLFSPAQFQAAQRDRLASGKRCTFEETGNLGRREDWFRRRSGD